MNHPSILGVLALVLLQALDVNGRSDLRSLFVLRDTETVGLPECDHDSCKRIDIDYEALSGDEALSVRFGQSDLVFLVSDNTPSGSHGRTRMFTLKGIFYTFCDSISIRHKALNILGRQCLRFRYAHCMEQNKRKSKIVWNRHGGGQREYGH